MEGLSETEFVGYDDLKNSGAKLLKDVQTEDGIRFLIFDKTPFYPEMGGQVCDTGVIKLESGEIVQIVNVQKVAGVILHFVG